MTTSLASQRLADENIQDRVRPFAFNPSIDDAAAAALRHQPYVERGQHVYDRGECRPAASTTPGRKSVMQVPDRRDRRRRVCFNSRCELSDADETAPDSRKKCADQNIDRIVAKRTAVSAHLDTKTSDFMLAGGVEQAGENN
jgi:hypothetical protein